MPTNPQWYPPTEPSWQPRTQDWARLITQYVYALRDGQQNVTQTIQNFNNNIFKMVTQQVTHIINNNSNGLIKPPVVYQTHFTRLTATYAPALWTGYIFVETDRSNAAYYSNSLQWVLLEATQSGSFESRWTGFNTYDTGWTWIETSRNNIAGLPPYPTYRWDGANWNFLSGEFYRNQNAVSTLAATFAANNSNNGNDVGARCNVIDFHHQLQWTATTANNNTTYGWAWGPDDDLRAGEGPIAREVDPSPTTGWQLYDGSNNVTYLKSDGTTATVNLPNLVSANNVAFLEFGNTSSNGVVAPVTPTFTGNSLTPTGSVTGTFAGNGSGNSNNFTTANFTSLLAGSVALTGPNPVGVSVTVSGNITANFAGNSVMPTGTISNNGQPASIVRRPWFRR